MTKPSHTPGPWKAQPAGYPTRQWDIVADNGRRNVAETICDHESNARLIAAAPELLEVVLGIVKWWQEGSAHLSPDALLLAGNDTIKEAASRAASKATGEEN
jgi:hypothetical protein